MVDYSKYEYTFYFLKLTMDLNPYKQQMSKAIEYLKTEFKSLQVGRASAGMLDTLNVETGYGSMKINQISHITVVDSQTLKVEPRDKKECKNIEKSIYDSWLGLAPQNEWSYIFVRVPEVTKERRLELVKKVKSIWEEAKANVRKVRQDAQKFNKNLLTNKEISEDEHKNNEVDIDNLIKERNNEVDNLVKEKSDNILQLS